MYFLWPSGYRFIDALFIAVSREMARGMVFLNSAPGCFTINRFPLFFVHFKKTLASFLGVLLYGFEGLGSRAGILIETEGTKLLIDFGRDL